MRISEFWSDDHTEREFEESGLQCCTRTYDMGHRCGYVALPKGHPLFGKDLYECYDMAPEIDVDGGITFSDGTGEIWVLGWDAAHSWHLQDPSIMSESYKSIFERLGSFHDWFAVIVDADMAERETRKFARQLAELYGKAVDA